MKRKEVLLLLLVAITALWQVFFLQNGMKWDFVDAFLPSRYFFSESVLNNQFPLWNPYLLYGVPIYADLVSVFNPEFWVIGNMFGYSNVTLQLVYVAYIFIAGVAFLYFLKQFGTEHKLSLALSVAYMLSGLSIGNAQHLAFVSGYAILPFVLASYFRFLKQMGIPNLVRLLLALFFMIFGSYPGLTIILGYLLLTILLYKLISNRADKSYIKKLFAYHLILAAVVIVFSSVLIVAFVQLSPFLDRFGGLSAELAQKHPFSVKSVLSFLLPMATGNDPKYFETDTSMSNGYLGIISLVLFLFCLTKKARNGDSYLFLFFGVFSLLASFGSAFFLRGFLYNYAPLMNMFQYPSIFRVFTILSILSFVGINLNLSELNNSYRKRLIFISGAIATLLLIIIWHATNNIDEFAFFDTGKSFVEELFASSRFDNIVFQGVIQVTVLSVFILITLKVRSARYYPTAILVLFIFDGIVSTQLSINYTVINNNDPIKFSNYIKSSPKGFPIPEVNPIGENSDKNASNEFTWMNNNVFPKKITFDGLVSFKLNGYSYLADNHTGLLEAMKKEAVVYFSDDVRKNTTVENFKSNTIFLSASDYNCLPEKKLFSDKADSFTITAFSPQNIEISAITNHPQLLVYQQNYYGGWSVYVDGEKQHLLKANFALMAVAVPSGKHRVQFKYSNPAIKTAFIISYLIFFILIALTVYYYIAQHPHNKRGVYVFVVSCILLFVVVSSINRYFYRKNILGLTPVIVEKLGEWGKTYSNDIRILLSTQEKKLKNLGSADKVCFIDERTNLAELSSFLMDSGSKYFAFGWQGSSMDNDIFDLIYSFYPTPIEQEINRNSGVILLEKSTKKQNYYYSETFETMNSSKWMQDKGRIKVDSITGNHSYSYNAGQEWGAAVEIPVGKELIASRKISIVTDVLFEKQIRATLLVFSAERAGKTVLYDVLKINKYAKYAGKWGRAAFNINLRNRLQEGDVIKIYFWNKNGAQFRIDNLKVKFSPAVTNTTTLQSVS